MDSTILCSPWNSLLLVTLCLAISAYFMHSWSTQALVPISVNYHFSRKCNKECGFCFHTAKSSDVATIADAKRGLAMLKSAGMRKLNFAGGEPFLYPKFLGELVVYAKQTLQLESVSIVSNGSLIKKAWLRQYSQHLDILAISCDSFNEDTNIRIGRGSGDNVKQLFQIRDWCDEYGIKFKLNTVVCQYNFDEDMAQRVADLRPFRWKVFQVLRVEGENDSDQTLRNVWRFEIKDEEFALFCKRHGHLECFVPESNKAMAESYLLLDEYLRFISGTNKNITSKSILEVGVHAALADIRWDKEAFYARGGVYEWTKENLDAGSQVCSGGMGKDLRW